METKERPKTQTPRGLDAQQLGHIRHIERLTHQFDGDWSGMGGRAHKQGDDFGGYVFQLSFAAYALALAHRNRLPNAPAVFKPTFERIMHKLLLPDAWMYWRDLSRGGGLHNLHQSERPEEWDPVVRDNIMYSAYVQSLSNMYNVLFDDDRYAKQGALTFDYWSFGWGGAPKVFAYDQNSLTDVIYWQMVEQGYLGVACEPNACFIACNMPAILGFRMNDLVTGNSLAEEVVAGFQQAWADTGFLDAGGHYHPLRRQDSGEVFRYDSSMPALDGWVGALMNAWNRDFVREHYPHQVSAHLVHGEEGRIAVRETVYNAKTFNLPFEVADRPLKFDVGNFGWIAAWASEMGDEETLRGLLKHADHFMNPTWTDGALTYPRNDYTYDENGNYTLMEPVSSNGLIPWARLNVPDGMWTLYNEPWDRAHFTEPLITEVSDDIDISAAYFDRASKKLTVRAALRAGRSGSPAFIISNVPTDATVTVDGYLDDRVEWLDDQRIRITCVDRDAVEYLVTVPSWNENS